MLFRRKLLPGAFCLALVSCAGKEQIAAVPVVPAPPPPAAIAPIPPEPPIPPSFAEWLSAFRLEASARGFKPSTLAALDDLAPIQRVVDLDRKQPEGTVTLEDYLSSHVTAKRISKGRETLARDRELLDSVAARYGVQPRFILAVLGIETDYGRQSGSFSVLQSLATLAYDGRRAAYFRGELMKALEIIDAGDVEPTAMRGSWAGAMGQVQFMPSSYLKYAVDFDGSGRRDIWTNKADVYASVANYLSDKGWHRDLGWGREVRLPDNFEPAAIAADAAQPLSDWRKLGFHLADGKKLPKAPELATLIVPPRSEGHVYLVSDNYRAIRAYNPSHFYALAIGQLADAIGD